MQIFMYLSLSDWFEECQICSLGMKMWTKQNYKFHSTLFSECVDYIMHDSSTMLSSGFVTFSNTYKIVWIYHILCMIPCILVHFMNIFKSVCMKMISKLWRMWWEFVFLYSYMSCFTLYYNESSQFYGGKKCVVIRATMESLFYIKFSKETWFHSVLHYFKRQLSQKCSMYNLLITVFILKTRNTSQQCVSFETSIFSSSNNNQNNTQTNFDILNHKCDTYIWHINWSLRNGPFESIVYFSINWPHSKLKLTLNELKMFNKACMIELLLNESGFERHNLNVTQASQRHMEE